MCLPAPPTSDVDAASSARTADKVWQEVFDGFQNPDHFQNFEQYAQLNHAAAPNFPGPPGPPTPPTHPMHSQGHAGGVNANLAHKNPQADILPMSKVDPDQSSRNNASNSDEDDLTPAQSRRKAQNRAAYVPAAAP